jgi:hypothetical protein
MVRHPTIEEINMSRQYGSSSWRKKVELALAGFAFTAMTAMIIGGTFGMLFPGGTIQA